MGHYAKQEAEQGDFKASDVLALAGLTYRQLNDWEQRAGIIDSERPNSDGWRKFTFEEVVALAICARLRDHFSLPLEQTGRAYEWLLGKRQTKVQQILTELAEQTLDEMKKNPKIVALLKGDFRDFPKGREDDAARLLIKLYANAEINKNHIRPVLCALKMSRLGLLVYLVTDMKTFGLMTEHSLVQWIGLRPITTPTIIFPLNDLLNEIFAAKGVPQYTLDKYTTSFRDYWNDIQEKADLTPSEREVLRVIRERGYQRVTAHIKGGQIIRVEREEDLATDEQAKLEDVIEAIRNADHQTVTVVKRDGKIVRIGRKASIKLDKVTGKT